MSIIFTHTHTHTHTHTPYERDVPSLDRAGVAVDRIARISDVLHVPDPVEFEQLPVHLYCSYDVCILHL